MAQEHKPPSEAIEPASEFEVVLPPGELLPGHYLDRRLKIKSGWLVLVLGVLSGTALTLSFNVPWLSWLAFFALVPWVLATAAAASVTWAMLGCFLLGLAFWMVNVYWVIPITIAGYLGQCVYLSSYFLLAGWLVRHCYQRRRLPFFLLLPVIWVGLELLRGHVITGFSWLLLGHSQYQWIRLIQISDLVGAYGVSFIVAMANGLIVDLLVQPLFVRGKGGSKPSLIVAVGVVSIVGVGVFSLVYGSIEMNRGQLRAGPRVAVVQENFPISVTRMAQNDREVFDSHKRLTLEAVGRCEADLIVWPESMAQPFLYPKVTELSEQNGEFGTFSTLVDDKPDNIVARNRETLEDFRNAQYAQKELVALACQIQTPLLVGSSARMIRSVAGNDDLQVNQRNSAFLCRADGLILHQRYDKTHLVPFGEYIPFRKAFPALYKLIISLSPYSFDHTIEEGTSLEVFAFTPANSKVSYRFATPICYEGTVPDLCRRFVLPEGEPKIDFLVNVSNDGWFDASWELSQHVVCYVFRAVENRICIARAVNTGISGFVDSSGRLHDLVSQDGRTRGVAGIGYAQLQIDPRISVYSRWGDWFALLCGLGGLALFVDSMLGPSKHLRARLLLVLMTVIMLADAVGRVLL